MWRDLIMHLCCYKINYLPFPPPKKRKLKKERKVKKNGFTVISFLVYSTFFFLVNHPSCFANYDTTTAYCKIKAQCFTYKYKQVS